MVNTSEFSKRIQSIIEYYDLSASSFAEKIGVQRSSISHILSGRNKPSLDFTLKVVDAFPQVSLYWLLLNKGSFPEETISPTKEINPEKEKANLFTQLENNPEETIQPNQPDQVNAPPVTYSNYHSEKKAISRVIIFFKDGSFEEYHN